MESYFIEDDIATIIISNGNDNVIIYQTPINNENVIYEELKSLPASMTELNELSLESQNSIWPVIKAIRGIINSFQPNAKYKAESFLYKNLIVFPHIHNNIILILMYIGKQ